MKISQTAHIFIGKFLIGSLLFNVISPLLIMAVQAEQHIPQIQSTLRQEYILIQDIGIHELMHKIVKEAVACRVQDNLSEAFKCCYHKIEQDYKTLPVGDVIELLPELLQFTLFEYPSTSDVEPVLPLLRFIKHHAALIKDSSCYSSILRILDDAYDILQGDYSAPSLLQEIYTALQVDCRDNTREEIEESLRDRQPSMFANVAQGLDTINDNVLDCCAEVIETITNDFQSTWTLTIAGFTDTFTILTDINNTLTTCCAEIISTITNLVITASVDLSGVYTSLADIENTLTICCAELLGTITADFRDTWTIFAAQTLCGATPITQAMTITESGYYCLANDIAGTIIIAANNVCLDLNCHTISASPGIISTGYDNISIFNGFITHASAGINNSGVLIQTSSHVNITDVEIIDCDYGITFSNIDDFNINNCTLFSNGLGSCALSILYSFAGIIQQTKIFGFDTTADSPLINVLASNCISFDQFNVCHNVLETATILFSINTSQDVTLQNVACNENEFYGDGILLNAGGQNISINDSQFNDNNGGNIFTVIALGGTTINVVRTQLCNNTGYASSIGINQYSSNSVIDSCFISGLAAVGTTIGIYCSAATSLGACVINNLVKNVVNGGSAYAYYISASGCYFNNNSAVTSDNGFYNTGSDNIFTGNFSMILVPTVNYSYYNIPNVVNMDPVTGLFSQCIPSKWANISVQPVTGLEDDCFLNTWTMITDGFNDTFTAIADLNNTLTTCCADIIATITTNSVDLSGVYSSFNATFTVLSDLTDCCSEVLVTLSHCFAQVFADFGFGSSCLRGPSAFINVAEGLDTINDNVVDCCAEILETLSIGFNDTFTSLTGIENTLTTCCAEIISTVTTMVDLNGVYTALTNIENTLTTCCADLNATIADNFQSTWTLETAGFNSTFTQITSLNNTVVNDFASTWTQLTTGFNGTFTALNNLNVTVTGDFSGIYTALAACCNSTFTQITALNNTITTDFQNTWTLTAAGFNSTFTQITSLNNTMVNDFVSTWTQLTTGFNGTFTALNNLNVTVTGDFSGIYTALAACCQSTFTQLTSLNNTVVTNDISTWTQLTNINTTMITDFRNTWTLETAGFNSTFTQITALNSTIANDFVSTWTQLTTGFNSTFTQITTGFNGTNTVLSFLVAANECMPTPIIGSGSVTISTPGTYCLVNNFTGSIAISSNNVTLDLNGKTITLSGGGAATAIVVGSNTDIVIKNGILNMAAGTTNNAIYVGSANNVQILNVNIINMTGPNELLYLYQVTNFIIDKCTFYNNLANQIFCYGCNQGIISNSIITNNSGTNSFSLIQVYESSSNVRISNVEITNNSSSAAAIGINLEANNCIVENCLIAENTGFSYAIFSADNNVLIDNCTIANNSISTGIYITDAAYNVIKNCFLASNATAGTIGIQSTSSTNNVVIDSCIVQSSPTGYSISGTESTVKNCTAESATTVGFIAANASSQVIFIDNIATGNVTGFDNSPKSTLCAWIGNYADTNSTANYSTTNIPIGNIATLTKSSGVITPAGGGVRWDNISAV